MDDELSKTAASSLAASATVHLWTLHRLLEVLRARCRPGLNRTRHESVDIAWELAGYGRGADVSMLPPVFWKSSGSVGLYPNVDAAADGGEVSAKAATTVLLATPEGHADEPVLARLVSPNRA